MQARITRIAPRHAFHRTSKPSNPYELPFHSTPIYLNIYISSPAHTSPTSNLARNNLGLPRRNLGNHSVIRLIRAPRLGRVHAVLAQLPRALHRLQDLVLGRGLVDRVGDPGVPSGLDVGTVGGGGGQLMSPAMGEGVSGEIGRTYGSQSLFL